VLLINGAYALAVSSPYWPENPLRIAPGESMDLQLILKNNAGAEALVVTGEIADGADAVTITDASKSYNVPAGGEAAVNVRVSIPKDSKIGGNYPVRFIFKTYPAGGEGGSVGIGSSIETKLPVFIVQQSESVLYNPEKASNWTMYLIVAIAVVVLFIVILALSRRKK
jgi:hypothetical protein